MRSKASHSVQWKNLLFASGYQKSRLLDSARLSASGQSCCARNDNGGKSHNVVQSQSLGGPLKHVLAWVGETCLRLTKAHQQTNDFIEEVQRRQRRECAGRAEKSGQDLCLGRVSTEHYKCNHETNGGIQLNSSPD